MTTALMGDAVAKKRSTLPESGESKRYGSMIRVGDEFAEAVRKICALSGKSAADYTAERLLSIVLDDYDKLLMEEAKAARERRK